MRLSEPNEPNFLRKFKSQYSGADSSRHERPLARPRKQKETEDDDAPTYVDEHGRDIITKAEYDAMLNGESHIPEGMTEQTPKATEDQQELVREDGQAVRESEAAAIGTLRKRRIGKVIGKDDEVIDNAKGLVNPGEKRLAKKIRKVRLSFDGEATVA